MIIDWLSGTIEFRIWGFILLGVMFYLLGAFHAWRRERKRYEDLVDELHRQLDEAQRHIDH